jgi:hypothetical protein
VAVAVKNEDDHEIEVTGGSFDIDGNHVSPVSTGMLISLKGDSITGFAGTITVTATNPDGSKSSIIVDVYELASAATAP